MRVHFHGKYEEDFTDQDGYYKVTDIPICYCMKEVCASKLGYKEEWVSLGIAEDTVYDFILQPVPLSADTHQIPSAGGGVHFMLNAGAAHAGRSYALLGSVSGTSPGTPLPGGKVLPLNWDPLTAYTLVYANTEPLTGFMGTLDGSGQAYAELGLYSVSLVKYIGTKLYFAYTLYDPFDLVSNPVEVEIVE